MKILMFPGSGNKGENKYIDILRGALETRNLTIRRWIKEMPGQRADIFHVHWPEVITRLQIQCKPRIRGEWIRRNFFSTINGIKRRGGAIVWTVHDLRPHEDEIGASDEWKTLRNEFIDKVDGYISLTGAGVTQARLYYPESAQKSYSIVRHPHYLEIFMRNRFGTSHEVSPLDWRLSRRGIIRTDIGIPSGGRLISILGNLRRNKSVKESVRVARSSLGRDDRLLVAGNCELDYEIEVVEAIKSDSRIIFLNKKLSEGELVDYHFGSDLILLGARDYFNSGAVYTALSLGTPIAIERTAINSEIASLVSNNFLYLSDGGIEDWDLQEILRSLPNVLSADDWMNSLTPFHPSEVALQQHAAYSRALLK